MDIFGEMSNFEKRFIPDYDRLRTVVGGLREAGLSIVVTSGSFDILHQGHALYLEKARQLGNVLIVGVDSDAKVRERKGPDRPVVPEGERLRMLTHLRCVDIVTLKTPEHPHLELLRVVRPDVLVVSQSTKERTPREFSEFTEYCERVVELEPQATMGTSARIRLLHVNGAKLLTEILVRRLPGFITDALQEFGADFHKEGV